jgi:hypothetical protein
MRKSAPAFFLHSVGFRDTVGRDWQSYQERRRPPCRASGATAVHFVPAGRRFSLPCGRYTIR